VRPCCRSLTDRCRGSYRIVDPRSGLVLERGRLAEENQPLPDTGNGPRVTILVDEASHAAAHLTEAVPT